MSKIFGWMSVTLVLDICPLSSILECNAKQVISGVKAADRGNQLWLCGDGDTGTGAYSLHTGKLCFRSYSIA